MGVIRDEIVKYLKKNKYCVLCTGAKDDVRATPVRYSLDDLKIIIYSESYTRKFRYLKKNCNVAVSLHSSKHPLKGIQLWGTAEVVTHRDPRHDKYLFPEAKRSEKLRQACQILNLIIVVPRRIVMLEQSPAKGYRYFVWEKAANGIEKEREVKTIRELSRLT